MMKIKPQTTGKDALIMTHAEREAAAAALKVLLSTEDTVHDGNRAAFDLYMALKP